MLKKIAKLACLGCCVLSANLVADEKKDGPEIYSGGFTLGTTLSNASSVGTNHFFTLGYFDDYFLFDVGFNFTNLQKESEDQKNYAQFMGHLGLRDQLFQNLYVTYGVTGSVVAGNLSDNSTPYSVGVFTGLDWQPMRHFLISAKINPYNYDRPGDNARSNEVFESGSIGFSYVF